LQARQRTNITLMLHHAISGLRREDSSQHDATACLRRERASRISEEPRPACRGSPPS
jgi:hypothetical protein